MPLYHVAYMHQFAQSLFFEIKIRYNCPYWKKTFVSFYFFESLSLFSSFNLFNLRDHKLNLIEKYRKCHLICRRFEGINYVILQILSSYDDDKNTDLHLCFPPGLCQSNLNSIWNYIGKILIIFIITIGFPPNYLEKNQRLTWIKAAFNNNATALWLPSWQESATAWHNFGRGPSNDYSIKVWF
jgi:hypothetical protein